MYLLYRNSHWAKFFQHTEAYRENTKYIWSFRRQQRGKDKEHTFKSGSQGESRLFRLYHFLTAVK